MKTKEPLSGRKFIQMMRPLLGLPENITAIKIEATSDGLVRIDLQMFPKDKIADFGGTLGETE